MDRNRVLIIAGVVLLPFLGLGARLVHLQIISKDQYIQELNSRSRSLEIAVPHRGRILDRNGNVLAEDRRAFDLHIILDEFEEISGGTEQLALFLGRSPAEIDAGIERIYLRIERQMNRRPKNERMVILRRERKAPYLLKRDIGFESAYLVETHPEQFPGLLVREGLKRTYPYGNVGGHLIGYVGKINGAPGEYERQLENGYFTEGFEEKIGEDGTRSLIRKGVFAEEVTGRAGTERTYNEKLRGKYGILIFERKRRGARKMVEVMPTVPGEDLDLTIDIKLQKYIENQLEPLEETACALVLNPHNGELLALVSNRTFNPNHFVPPATAENVNQYLQDQKNKPLLSRAYRDQFQLGSIFKIVSAAAALENKLVTGETKIECTGKFKPNLKHFNCHIWNSYQGLHGPLTLSGALEVSCNIYFYWIGEQMGIQGLNYWAQQFGLGRKTGIDLLGEVPGQLPRRQKWPADGYALAIGQHDLMVSPLQIGVLMSVIANGGKRIIPHVLRGTEVSPQPTLLSPDTIEILRSGLYEVVHGARGTARKPGLIEFDVAGKTSSAQNQRGKKAHAWFGGFAPHNDPLYTVIVFVKHGGSGGESAAPIAEKIIKYLMAPEETAQR